MEYDELELDTLGDQKTALFVILSDTDSTFNFVAALMYSQLFNLLCDKADDFYGGRLLYHEAIDYLREMQRRRDRELSFSDLPQMEMDKLCIVDHYPSDRFTFSSHGYDLHIENELVADAFAGLSVQEQSILILHFVLDLPDQEVGRLVGMSRSAVQRRRAKSLTELRIKLAALMPKGG